MLQTPRSSCLFKDTEESAEPFSSGRQLVKYPLAKFVVDIQSFARNLTSFAFENTGGRTLEYIWFKYITISMGWLMMLKNLRVNKL